jgi:thiosulfate reductase cytochrome b subunit
MDQTISTERIKIHTLSVRIFHWVNAVAMVMMITSGWQIYNASPLFESIEFPDYVTLGGWLGGGLLWHFAAMWLFVSNLLIYVLIGIFSGHFKQALFPVTPRSVAQDLGKAIRGKLPHDVGSYNAVQKISYLGVIAIMLLVFISGLCVWKPVQFQTLGILFGGYEGARLVHFICMSLICAFIVMHLVLVAIVPSTFIPMITGWARKSAAHAKGDSHVS